jgi:hypothetical protein
MTTIARRSFETWKENDQVLSSLSMILRRKNTSRSS